MKKLFKRVFAVILLVALVLVGVKFGPAIYNRLFGSGGIDWASQRFEATLTKQNRMDAYSASIPGVETVSQDAILYKAWTYEIPYDFTISYFVDLDTAEVRAEDRNGDGVNDVIRIYVRAPYADKAELTVQESRVKRTDPLKFVTDTAYAKMLTTLKEKLFAEYSVNPEYLDAAWQSAVENIRGLLAPVIAEMRQQEFFDVEVLQGEAPASTEAPAEA